MRDDPQSILTTSRVQQEACDMLNKRCIKGDDEPWETPVGCLWSFRRKDHMVVHVLKVNKENALALKEETNDGHLVVIFNECTPAAGKLLRAIPNVEVWNVQDLCVHPFKFSFIIDAGIEPRPLPRDHERLPKMLFDDPVRHYLGANRGDVVWTKIAWGSLGVGTTHRYVK
jgi:hypothetical protein